jgi:serine/threonine-protein kinase
LAQTPKPADAVRIGQVFLGKYRIESIIGQGGMGVVAEVTHLQLNQRLAIKMLRQDVLLDHDAVERFMREAQAAAKLKSEYVAKVSDVGALENGTPYMVMEYLEGHDLGALISQRGKVALPWTCDLMLQTAEALAEAHSLGIVHRDIKPTNLFVTWRPDGTALIKVLDFGISKTTLGTDMHLTQTQSLLGTPAYMSPEQMRSARLVDARTDIWSLGSVMYEMLEGRKPFEAESFSEMCVKVAVDPPSPMFNAPPELQSVVLRCLAKTPELRYATMAEFARDLVPFVADPHQASLLVERMQRMLRRSEANWEGSTTGVGRSVPNHVRDARGSQPVQVPWHGGSEPSGVAIRPLQTAQSAVPQRYTGGVDSAPARAPSEAFGAPKKRSAFAFVLLAAAVVTAAAVAIAMSVGGGDSEKPAPSVVTPAETKPADPKPAETKALATETRPAETKPAEPKIIEAGSGGDEIEMAPTDVKTEPAGSVATQKTGTGKKGTQKAGTQKAGTQKAVPQTTGTQATGTQKTVAPPPKETPKETPKPPDPNCDVYSHPHGCPK